MTLREFLYCLVVDQQQIWRQMSVTYSLCIYARFLHTKLYELIEFIQIFIMEQNIGGMVSRIFGEYQRIIFFVEFMRIVEIYWLLEIYEQMQTTQLGVSFYVRRTPLSEGLVFYVRVFFQRQYKHMLFRGQMWGCGCFKFKRG
eukprot:TRINITY_DN3618_c0_g1_i20.p3 TRINITY_DN3618_c0_g1~~TRINITY_DN3618_c0_g1_i20.p3  ORF type:complete len:143 (-),score=4.35 TRINITY_DN3618_c0_g1_i20:247-675(-)